MVGGNHDLTSNIHILLQELELWGILCSTHIGVRISQALQQELFW